MKVGDFNIIKKRNVIILTLLSYYIYITYLWIGKNRKYLKLNICFFKRFFDNIYKLVKIIYVWILFHFETNATMDWISCHIRMTSGSKYFSVISSGPHSELTKHTNVEYSTQFLFWAEQLSTQNVNFVTSELQVFMKL